MSRMTRQHSIKWILAATSAMSALEAQEGFFKEFDKGYGSDPNLINSKVTWDLIMTKEQLSIAHALCELIIPADEFSPSASDVGVPDFINEWVSAPYPQQQGHKNQILPFLDWLNETSKAAHGKVFYQCDQPQKIALCDQLAFPHKAKPEWRGQANQFGLFRQLTGGAFYTTPEGMKDLKYMGNVPQATFKGPPPEVLKHLGLI